MDNYLFNSWRAFRYTLKGKRIGCSEDWKDYNNFYTDMISTYKKGMRLCRINKNRPFSKDNCNWKTEEEIANLKPSLIKITFENKTQSIKDWAKELELNTTGITTRYHSKYTKGKCTIEEVLFGIKLKSKKIITDYKELSKQKTKNKISKMLSSYKCKDHKRGMNFNLTKEWFSENVINKECFYCKDTEKLGCDRLDNSKGHTTDNCVPCCSTCNTVRLDKFTVEEMKILGRAIKDIREKKTVNQLVA